MYASAHPARGAFESFVSPRSAPLESDLPAARLRRNMSPNTFMERRSRPFVLTAALLLVSLLGVLDYLNGPDVSLLIFYAVPVFVAAWYAGRGAGFLTCAASGLAWIAVAHATAEHYASPFIAYWNAFVRLGFIILVAHLVASFRRSLSQER
jgi:thiamine transporter ThiT